MVLGRDCTASALAPRSRFEHGRGDARTALCTHAALIMIMMDWWLLFGVISNTLVRSGQRPYMHGSVRRRPNGCGLGRGLLDRADDITAARERSESLLRYSDVITRMHTSHAPPLEPNRAWIVWRN